MKRTLQFAVLFFTASQFTFAQHQHDKWYFGNKAALDFSTGTVVSMAGSQMNAQEGCTSIADSCTGNLLFYTDGLTAWDATHSAMPNGSFLLGGFSSTQAAMIVPYPGSKTKYCIFTTDDTWGPNGFRYSVVDMSLPGNGTAGSPLGDVVVGKKSIILSASSTERLTACMHANCRDIWVLEHGKANNVFNAWLITSAGVAAAPVISNTGTSTLADYGALRLSHNGKKLLMTDYQGTGTNVFLYDFNNATGVVSNQIDATAAPAVGLTIPYGCEFSPDDRLFYITHISGIEQFQTSSPTTTEYHVCNNSSGNIGTVQAGPDCKLYCSSGFLTVVSVIATPNIAGAGCGFNALAVPLIPGQSFASGLPNFITWKPKACTPAGFTFSTTPCSFLVQFNDTECSVKSRSWNFGDPASGGANTSTLANPAHTFSAAGTYSVTLIMNKGGCLIDTVILPVLISQGGLILNMAATPTNCNASIGSATVTPSGGTAPYSYSWSPIGGNSSMASAFSAGTYTVNVTDALGCTGTQTVSIIAANGPAATASVVANATCNNSNGSAAASASGGTLPYTFSWSPTGGNSSTATGLAAGNYSVTVSDANGCSSVQAITISNSNGPNVIISAQNILCNGANTGTVSAAVAGGSLPYTYLWSGGQITSAVSNLASGNYSVTVTDGNGCTAVQSVIITQPTALTLTLSSSGTCGNNSGLALASASGGSGSYTYLWSPAGGVTASASGLASGNYSCTITDSNGCTITSAVSVATYSLPVAVAFSDTTISEGHNAMLTASGGGTYLWSTGSANSGILVAPLVTTIYCVTVTDSNSCTDSACVTVTVEPTDCGPVSSEDAFVLPTAFSPNTDGQNDFWRLLYVPILADCIVEFEVAIYNRWGERVFDGTTLAFSWDGSYNGKQSDTSVFAFYVNATLKDGARIRKSGNISLLR